MDSNLQIDNEKLWKGVLDALRTEVSEGTFNTYIRGTSLVRSTVSGEKMICEIGCNSTFVKNTIDSRYSELIRRELVRISGRECEVLVKTSGKVVREDEAAGPLFETVKQKNFLPIIKRARLRDDFLFDNFAVAGSNQMAHAAALAVAKNPGPIYNPLFIYGGVGVGKTHLMQAVGHEVIKNGENEVLFCSGEEFTNDLVEAIRYKTTDRVRAKYRKVKLLMIDDVQFIAGKTTVQEEFFHTFNSIQREGGQIIMTSDKPPAEIPKLEERLKSRFGAGLTVDVGPADFELRTAILLIKAKQRGYEMAMETAQIIAANISGVRELQGFLVRIETEEKVKGRRLEPVEVKSMLNVAGSDSVKNRIITPIEVINAVSGHFGVGVQQIKSERRTKMIAWPRQILMFILRNDLRLPLEEVGRLLGGRDHTTVMHATEKVRTIMEEDVGFAAEMADIKRKIFNSY